MISVSSVCTKSRLNEFMITKKTLEQFHDCSWVVVTDSQSTEFLSQFDNVKCVEQLERDGCHFSILAEDQKYFRQLMMKKMEAMRIGIKEHGSTLFLDSDLIFLRELDENYFNFLDDPTKSLFLTSHCHSFNHRDNEKTYGTYNVGMLATKDITFPDLWEEETLKLNCSLGLEQKPVTLIAEQNMDLITVAPPTYNYGWWRAVVSEDINRVFLHEEELCFDFKPIINLHVHSDPNFGRMMEKQFLEYMVNIMKFSDKYETILDILNNEHGTELKN